jgi:hypothetical protein
MVVAFAQRSMHMEGRFVYATTLQVPKKTRLYVEQAAREREQASTMHTQAGEPVISLARRRGNRHLLNATSSSRANMNEVVCISKLRFITIGSVCTTVSEGFAATESGDRPSVFESVDGWPGGEGLFSFTRCASFED